MRRQIEKSIQNEIVTRLNIRFKGQGYFRQVDVNGVPMMIRGRMITKKNPNKGISDILGCLRGQFIAIEVKVKGKKTTPEQKVFLDSITNSGGLAIVVNGYDETLNLIYEWFNHPAA